MYSSSSKVNERCNGKLQLEKRNKVKTESYLDHNKQMNTTVQNLNRGSRYVKYIKGALFNGGIVKTEVKEEVIEVKEEDVEENITDHSIIGLENEKLLSSFSKVKFSRANHHETLQRIRNRNELVDVCNYYQKNWFSAGLERLNLEDRSREERIEITRHEFRRQLYQIMRSNLGHANKLPEITKSYQDSSGPCKSYIHGYDRLVAPRTCEIDNCFQPALPCTKHCTLHVMYNPEQVLFNYCTAKFADNTQCSVPVLNITHELPLCPEHARKRDNYKLYQEAKPKKLRKKVKPSAMIRPQKRNKKKKKTNKPIDVTVPTTVATAILELPAEETEIQDTIETESPELVEDMHIVDQVLGLNGTEGLEHDLTAQASQILEETDISTVLSTIHVDEFNDFFAVNRNGEFEQPSREEAEELDKALAEIDNDVKSLEKLSQTQELLDSFLDEHALAEQLVHLPEVFHNVNSYTTCGDSMVAQTSSYLLPVEPQSHT